MKSTSVKTSKKSSKKSSQKSASVFSNPEEVKAAKSELKMAAKAFEKAAKATLKETIKSQSKKSSSSKKSDSAHGEVMTVKPSVTSQILSKVIPTPLIKNNLTSEQKIQKIQKNFAEIMTTLGLDLSDDSLQKTPNRVAKMYVNEVFGGLNPDNFPSMTVIENKMQYDQMIVVQNIQCLSFCEHHFLPIDGHATVAYVPEGKVIGLSKINRIVKYFSRRPQVQERLTKQIADCLQTVLGAKHVAVHIRAKHYCVIMRGVEDARSLTSTSDLRGDFKDLPETREEFLAHVQAHV